MASIPKEQLNQVDGLDIYYENGVCVMRLNRPNKLNAINLGIYDGIREILNTTSKDDTVKLVYITGTGKYFSSGNEMSLSAQNPLERSQRRTSSFEEFVKAFINYPKLIVIGVNGPAVGIAVTILPLADFVYASDVATFLTPFTKFGLVPEGCSSYTFPKIMGYARANEVLLASRKLTAQEAYDRGLVSDIIHHSEFHEKVLEKVKYLASLPKNSVMYSKALVCDEEREYLLKVNERECTRLDERFSSEEFINAAMAFVTRSSKL